MTNLGGFLQITDPDSGACDVLVDNVMTAAFVNGTHRNGS